MPPEQHASTPQPPREDLGLGGVVVQRSKGRFMHRDGTPGVRKYGLGKQFWFRTFLHALSIPWLPFFVWTIGLMLLLNGAFALGYLAIPGSIGGADALQVADPFLRALSFSVGVFTAVGGGPMFAVGSTATWLVTFESIFGIVAIIAFLGMVLARMTRPRAQIRFSQSGVMAPYEGGRGFMFRMVNRSPAELYEVSVRINLSMLETVAGRTTREFYQLALERDSVEFFPLHWTIVHPITPDSPLARITPDRLRDAKAEFLILVTAWEDTFSTRVTSRTSYLWDEVRWDAKFADIFVDSPDGVITIDVERLDRLDRLADGATREPSPSEQPA